VGDAMRGTMFPVDVELAVTVASAGALPFPTGVGVGDENFLPEALGVAVQNHVAPTVFRLWRT
jgi:hypothetical protein